MKIAVASGKGGTGKTTVSTNLAKLIEKEYEKKEDHRVWFLDCDVEEPNAHLFLKPSFTVSKPVLVKVPQIDLEKCDYCARCSEVCAFNALAVLKEKIIFFEHMCHSCGSCTYFCPQEAIKEVSREVGVVQEGFCDDMGFAHGILNVGEAISPPVIDEVKSYQDWARVTIIDVPPGTSCPVIAALKDIDFCLLVTEPTPFGLNDMGLLVDLLRSLNIPFAVVINRSDLGNEKVEMFCREEKIPVFLKIPFDKEIARISAEGGSLVEEVPWVRDSFSDLWSKIKEMLGLWV